MHIHADTFHTHLHTQTYTHSHPHADTHSIRYKHTLTLRHSHIYHTDARIHTCTYICIHYHPFDDNNLTKFGQQKLTANTSFSTFSLLPCNNTSPESSLELSYLSQQTATFQNLLAYTTRKIDYLGCLELEIIQIGYVLTYLLLLVRNMTVV